MDSVGRKMGFNLVTFSNGPHRKWRCITTFELKRVVCECTETESAKRREMKNHQGEVNAKCITRLRVKGLGSRRMRFGFIRVIIIVENE